MLPPLENNPSRHVSLSEWVYRSIHTAIINGTYKPGEMLRQEEVARNLGVSRAPVREALPKLEAVGVVKQLPRRGYMVVSLQPEEIKEIFELRMLIEVRTATIATQLRKEQDIFLAEAIFSQMKNLDVKKSRQSILWFGLNSEFHKALLKPSGRKHFMRAINNLRTVVEPYIRVETCLTGNVEQANLEHQQILCAFKQQDVKKMAVLTKMHIQNTTKRLLTGLKNH